MDVLCDLRKWLNIAVLGASAFLFSNCASLENDSSLTTSSDASPGGETQDAEHQFEGSLVGDAMYLTVAAVPAAAFFGAGFVYEYLLEGKILDPLFEIHEEIDRDEQRGTSVPVESSPGPFESSTVSFLESSRSDADLEREAREAEMREVKSRDPRYRDTPGAPVGGMPGAQRFYDSGDMPSES